MVELQGVRHQRIVQVYRAVLNDVDTGACEDDE